jgi:hypothetical protein
MEIIEHSPQIQQKADEIWGLLNGFNISDVHEILCMLDEYCKSRAKACL